MMHSKRFLQDLLSGSGLVYLLLLGSPQAQAQEADDASQEVEQVGHKTQAQLDADFTKLLTDCKLVGFFTDSNASPDKLLGDSYSIKSVTRAEGNLWTFAASIEYGGRSIPIAMKMPVEWAGDTPVLSVTRLKFPLLGTYSARVLFYDDQYVGVWSGDKHGGQMFGRVVPDADSTPGAAEPGADEGKQDHGEHGDQGGDGAASGGALGDQAAAPLTPALESKNWPSFRGPGASGVAEGYATPVEWDVESGENIKWRVEVPGMSHSSPVIWGDKIFVTTAIRAEGEQELKVGLYGSIEGVPNEGAFAFALYCFDKNTGAELWNQISWEGKPKYQRHPKGSYAASSPATDGEHVLAFYGQEGLYCYDLGGELKWRKTFGDLDSGYYMAKQAQWGFSSSPILHEGKVIIQCDVQEGSFLMALDAKSGEEIWRTAREEVPTWSTPTVVVTEKRQQVVCNGYKHIGGYDLNTGKELWKLVGGGDIPVPTPIFANGLIFITNAHGMMAPIYAIDPDVSGTLEMQGEGMAWSSRRGGNYMQTPLAYGEDVYFCSDAGVLASYDMATGEQNYRERLGEGSTGFTGSGVAADGKLYFTSEQGDVHVLLAGLDMEQLAKNSLGEPCLSVPAISEGILYYHTTQHLLAIE